ncbi:MAG: T9SS C-terminal target domain-containing protein, partial [Chitinophagia bacterium]|nr:T9SS C-terminal target domain-containing protein [Chitinophagia bacterium]
NPLPHAGTISGPATLCPTTTGAFTATVAGGNWSSAAAGIVSVDAAGTVTGVTSGTANITYTVVNGCGTDRTTSAVTVSPVTDAGTITGAASVCVTAPATFRATVSGGTWSALPAGRANIATDGTLTPITTGADTVVYTVTDACGTDVTTMVTNIDAVPVTGTLSTIFGLTPGAATTVTSTTTGGSWSVTNTTNATVSTGGVVTALNTGNDTVVYTIANACATVNISRGFVVTGASAAGTISGPTGVCQGSFITLTSSVAGGRWSSSTPAIASVAATTGSVRGNSAGMVVITYTSGSAVSTYAVLVNNNTIGAVSGVSSLCPSTSTTFTDLTPGGTWTNSNPSIGSINAGTGVYNATASGADTIKYTVVNACGVITAKRNISVTLPPSPGSISGTLSTVCNGRSFTYTNSVRGGVWAFSNPTVATIAAVSSPSVTITGMAVGADTLMYTVTGACGLTSTVTRVININTVPAIGGGTTTTVAVGGSITLTNSVSGGTWSTIYPTIASVSTAGVVRGRAAGMDTIKYKLTNTCGTSTAIYLVSVTASKGALDEMSSTAAAAVKVYPNPSATGLVTLEMSDAGMAHDVMVIDTRGRLVMQRSESNHKFTIDLSEQPAGMYIIKLKTGDEIQEVRLV